MKVTAILSDELVNEVVNLSHGKNITESLTIALKEWTDLKHVIELNEKVRIKPLKLNDSFSAEQIRKINRN
jgi:hypothetical protein